MENLLQLIDQKKSSLTQTKSLPKAQQDNLHQWLKIELTYSSNAIEGNTLSRQETALVVEKNQTVEGKPLKDHLEAINHAQAWEYLQTLINSTKPFTEIHILNLHRLILDKIDDTNAGRYRTVPVRISGSTVTLPNPIKVPDLMKKLIHWLNQSRLHPAQLAAEFHLRFVSIHPFVDGNGRTARLLFNLILLKHGFPPTIIPVEKRREYINSIEAAQLTGQTNQYYSFMYHCILNSFDYYPKTIAKPAKLLTIGQLAQLANESISTIRFWTLSGLLPIQTKTKGGYQLYNSSVLTLIKKIRQLQHQKRLTIKEIKTRLAS